MEKEPAGGPKVCTVCAKPINGKVWLLAARHGGGVAHHRCMKLAGQREVWADPSATELGEAKRTYKQDRKAAFERGDGLL